MMPGLFCCLTNFLKPINIQESILYIHVHIYLFGIYNALLSSC